MSYLENGTVLFNRQGVEDLTKRCQISGEADSSPRISRVHGHEQDVRTEADGRSTEPVTEDLYSDKTHCNKTKTQEANNKTRKDSSLDLENIMSGKEQDSQDNEDDENERDSVERNENKKETEEKPIKSDTDLLNSKYVEDNDVDYNNLYENLPSSEEQEDYLPEEFRIPSSLSSASSTISEVTLKSPIKRMNREKSNDNTTLNEESLNTEDREDAGVGEGRYGENDGLSVDGDEYGDFKSETEDEESEEEEEETDEDDEEDEEEGEEHEKVEEDYKTSSVESCSSVPTFYSDREEEEISTPTTSSLEEIPEPEGEETAQTQQVNENDSNSEYDEQKNLDNGEILQNIDDVLTITREVSGRSASSDSVVYSDFDDVESTIFVGREGSQLATTTKNRSTSSAQSYKTEITLRNWSRFTYVSTLSQEKRDVTSDDERKAGKKRKIYQKKKVRTEKRNASIKALEIIANKNKKQNYNIVERQWSSCSEEQFSARPKRKPKKHCKRKNFDKKSNSKIEGEPPVHEDTPFLNSFSINKRAEETSPRPLTSSFSSEHTGSFLFELQSDSERESIEPIDSRTTSTEQRKSVASCRVWRDRIDSCNTIIEHSRPSSYELSRSPTIASCDTSRNIEKVKKANAQPSKIRVVSPLKVDILLNKKKRPLPTIKNKTKQRKNISRGKPEFKDKK